MNPEEEETLGTESMTRSGLFQVGLRKCKCRGWHNHILGSGKSLKSRRRGAHGRLDFIMTMGTWTRLETPSNRYWRVQGIDIEIFEGRKEDFGIPSVPVDHCCCKTWQRRGH
jgi:hypothetical protein